MKRPKSNVKVVIRTWFIQQFSRLSQDLLSLTTQANKSLRNVSRRQIYFLIGLFILLVGLALSMCVLIPPEQPLFPNTLNRGTIVAYNGKEPIEDIEYTVELLPVPESEDVLVVIYTNRERSASTRYEVMWPGKVRLHPLGTVEAVSGVDSEFLGVKIDWQGINKTRLVVEGRDSEYYQRCDKFIFYWVNGKEKIGFTDRRLRLTMVPISGTLSFQVSFVGSQQLLQESPASSRIKPSAEFGGISYIYEGQESVILVYTELGLRNLLQYIVLLSGILIGLATNLISQQIVEYVEEWRERRHK